MATNLIIQYSIVGAILAGAVVWVIVKAIQAHKNRGKFYGGCCGCALKEKCTSPKNDRSRK